MDDAGMAAKYAAIDMDDVSGKRRAWLQAFNDIAIAPGWDKANILAVSFSGNRETKLAGKRTNFRLLHAAQRKPQYAKLRLRCRKQKIALTARKIMRAVKRAIAQAVKP